MRRCLPVLIVSFLLGGCAQRSASVHEIGTAKELQAKLASDRPMVIHTLDQETYAKGHIPGAVNIDYEKMTVEMLPKDKGQPMVFYCVGGMCPVGRMAADKAAGWGYEQVWVYTGGMKDWERAGMAVASGK